jgi:hypothetical protein
MKMNDEVKKTVPERDFESLLADAELFSKIIKSKYRDLPISPDTVFICAALRKIERQLERIADDV